MRTRLTVATAIAGTLLATCHVSGPAQATPVLILKADATPGIVTLVGRGGGGKHARGGSRGGGGKHAHGGGRGGGGKHARGAGKRHYGSAKRHYGGGKPHAYKGGHKRHGYYGRYRRYGSYGLRYSAYGYGGGCGWLYGKARATGNPYWWNRYYSECTGYY